ncbi:MAG: DNA methyltransferase, partial [Pseudomonadota bacterium]|nr:DNA methyltransferase [Pseudomonadota bacterium]
KERHEHETHELIIHPTQKPLSLCDKLIKASRPKGGFKVLVPFLGSGSECIATICNGGEYLGFDINPEYVFLSKERLHLLSTENKALGPQMSLL